MSEKHTVIEGTIEEINAKFAEQQAAEHPPADPPEGEGTPPADPPAEPPADPPAEPPADPPAAEPFDRYKFLSETFEQPIGSDEDIVKFKSTVIERMKQYDDLQKQYDEAVTQLKSYNPRQHFASDDDYIVNQLKIKYPDQNPEVITKALTSDLKTTDPVMLAAWKELLNDPKHEVFSNESQAYKYVCKKFGYDPEMDFADQDEDVQIAVKAAAKEARTEFGKLKSQIEVPQTIDLTAEKARQEQEAKAQYDKLKPLVERDLKPIQAGLEKVEITAKAKDGKPEVLMSFDLGDFKNSKEVQQTIAQVTEAIARNAREWTPELAEKVVAETLKDLQNRAIIANLPQMFKAHKDELYKQFMDEKFEKENNSRPLSPDKTNPNMTAEQKKITELKQKVKQDLGLTGRQFYAT